MKARYLLLQYTCFQCYASTCGNGRRDGNEQCDDGLQDNWGCRQDCSAPLKGFACWGGNKTHPDICVMNCRNLVNKLRKLNPIDICDDGNTKSGDGCSSSCQRERGFVCVHTYNSFYKCSKAVCGNGRIERPEEECDDFNYKYGDGCNKLCQIEPGYECKGSICSKIVEIEDDQH
mgnify:CR=1 FL=1